MQEVKLEGSGLNCDIFEDTTCRTLYSGLYGSGEGKERVKKESGLSLEKLMRGRQKQMGFRL